MERKARPSRRWCFLCRRQKRSFHITRQWRAASTRAVPRGTGSPKRFFEVIQQYNVSRETKETASYRDTCLADAVPRETLDWSTAAVRQQGRSLPCDCVSRETSLQDHLSFRIEPISTRRLLDCGTCTGSRQTQVRSLDIFAASESPRSSIIDPFWEILALDQRSSSS